MLRGAVDRLQPVRGLEWAVLDTPPEPPLVMEKRPALVSRAAAVKLAEELRRAAASRRKAAVYAQRNGLRPTRTIDLGGVVTINLVPIPAGKFIMGTPEPESERSLLAGVLEYKAAFRPGQRRLSADPERLRIRCRRGGK
jgi:hypothetical protein